MAVRAFMSFRAETIFRGSIGAVVAAVIPGSGTVRPRFATVPGHIAATSFRPFDPFGTICRCAGSTAAFLALKLMHQGGGNIGGGKSFLQKNLNQVILPLEVTALKCGAEFVQESASARLLDFGHRRNFGAVNPGFLCNVRSD